jgi:hypothetical protein
MTEKNNILRQTAATSARPRLAPRPLLELYKLPGHAIVTPDEAEGISGITKSGLAVRRAKGEWPPYLKFGRLVRYRLSDLITAPNEPRDPVVALTLELTKTRGYTIKPGDQGAPTRASVAALQCSTFEIVSDPPSDKQR